MRATARPPRFRRRVSRSAGAVGLGVALVALLGAGSRAADEIDPEQDRQRLVAQFAQRFPGAPLDDYVYGAMIANPDARAQYEQIMEFPPFLNDIETGKRIWDAPFRNGKRFADCFPDGGRGAAARYPRYDERLGRVITFEAALNACLQANGEPAMVFGERQPMGVLTAYARSLSDGARIEIEIASPAARRHYAAGRDLFFRRIGQLNAACAGCHLHNAGNVMRMEIISPALGHATHWPIFRGGEELMTFQGRFKRCMEQMRAVPFGYDSEEWNDLEYFLTYLSRGLPMKAAVFRK